MLTPFRNSLSRTGTWWRWLCWFGFFNGLALALLGLNYLAASPGSSWQANLFSLLALYGHFLFLAMLPIPLLFLLGAWHRARPFVLLLTVTIYCLMVLVALIDQQVFSIFRFHINGMVWGLLTGGAAREIFVFSAKMWGIALLIVLAAAAAEWLLARALLRLVNTKPVMHGWPLVAASLTVMLAGQLQHAWANARQDISITRQVRLLPLAQPLLMDDFLRKYGLVDVASAAPSLSAPNSDTLNYPLRQLTCNTEKQPFNLIIIVIESLRADMLNPEVLPNIYRFAQQSWVFENHYSSGNATRYGIFGLLYGVHGTYWHTMLREGAGSELINQLDAKGYQFMVQGSAPLISPEFDRTVFAQVKDRITPRTKGESVAERDQQLTRDMLVRLDNAATDPFFSFTFYDAPHAFAYPADFVLKFQPAMEQLNYLGLSNDTDPTPLFNRYRNSMNFSDQQAGKLLQLLQDRDLLQNTVVVITGDHGKEFNENRLNYWGHNSNYARYQTHVPLIIRWPGKSPRVFTHRTSHVDLVPTLLRDLLGCTNRFSDFSTGRHLLDTSPRDYVIASGWEQYAIIEEDRITVTADYGGLEIYDLSYRPIPGAKLRNDIALQVMQEISRFQ